jgi:hypothetical protein
MSIEHVLSQAPVTSMDGAIRVMQAIDMTLDANDGLRWFNHLYLRVTLGVDTAARGAQFLDPGFLRELDVVFANMYFSAVATGLLNLDAAPSAWQPLLRARHNPRVAPIQFALGGMNAHINRDLPDGIVQSFLALGGDPLLDRTRVEDFTRINDVLERVEKDVKTEFLTGAIAVIDRAGAPLDDVIAMWNVRQARAAAWTNAQVLWGLRTVPVLRARFFDRLDRLVGMSSRGLLLPVDTVASTIHGQPASR